MHDRPPPEAAADAVPERPSDPPGDRAAELAPGGGANPAPALRVAELDAMSVDAFTAELGDVFEASPWVARRAAEARPFGTLDALHGAMVAVVDRAREAEQLVLIRAHPDLAGRAAIAGELTDASAAEQAGAGLDRLTPEEFARFGALNRRYRERFGFPFVVAVAGHTKHGILALFEARLEHDADTERREALSQIARIARFRLEARLPDPD